MGLSLYIREFETRTGTRRALILSPTSDLVVDISRLDVPAAPSDLDREIVGLIDDVGEDVHVSIFRAGGADTPGLWRFQEGLSEKQMVALAEHLLVGQLPVYRGLVRRGICLHVHVELPIEVAHAFRDATELLIQRIMDEDERTEADRAMHIADVWLLRNLSFYFTVGFGPLMDRILPEKLSLMEKRLSRGRQMYAGLPEALFEL